mgnify:FL=1
MRKTLLCGALIGLAAACGRKHPAVELPPALAAAPHVSAGRPALTVTLTADGRILVARRQVDLDGLSAALHAAAVEREPLPGSSLYAARLVVRLRVDRAAPWQHVQWLLTLLAEERVWRTRFVYADPVFGEVDREWNLPRDGP